MNIIRKRHPNVEAVINKWLHDNFSIYDIDVTSGFEVCGQNIYFYTDNVDILVGRHGYIIDRLNSELRNSGINKKLHIVELSNNCHTHEIRTKRRWI